MFTLEIIQVNKKENLFFEDTEDYKTHEEEFISFHKGFDETYIDSFYKKSLRTHFKREQLEDGSFRKTVTKSYFKNQQIIEKYYKEFFTNNFQLHEFGENNTRILIDSRKESINSLRISWQTSNHIFTEANILDVTGKFIRCINSCSQHVCIRFGECTPDKNCSSIYPESDIFKKSDVSFHHIPISSIKRR